ncbi:MAG: indole-3-glycerol phosphate synthase TrpC [Planctomycetia bacterium]|nr:indole-3-glycerol phosphate synthase TrpC [Planctomycetia bacterium]
MGTILDVLADKAHERVAKAKEVLSLDELRTQAQSYVNRRGDFAFERALQGQGLSFICECKKASPSKGIIVEDFPYLQIAQEYEKAGADCVSVLTEPVYFLGANNYLREIATTIATPCIRKDFIVDEYMIYEAKILDASAVLLICAILTDEQLRAYFDLAESLGLSVLVEAHDEAEIASALSCGARLIGVNNRNLKDFSVNVSNALNLRRLVGDHALFVAESGIKTAEEVGVLRRAGVDAVLIGETLMRASDKGKMLRQFREA